MYYIMDTKKINNVQIRKVPIPRNNVKVKGSDFFNELYFNCMLLARTNSGKTTCLYNILKNTVDERTDCYLFSSSIDIDPIWDKIKSMLLNKGCNVYSYPHFIIDGVSILPGILDGFNEGEEDEESEEEPIQHQPQYPGFGHFFHMPGPEEVKKKRKKKYKNEVPKRVMIFDDLSSGDGVKHPHVTNLLTKSRHYKMRCFVSCHDVTNLSPTALGQIRNFMLFPGISDSRIIELANKCDIGFDNDDRNDPYLLKMYKYATDKSKFKFPFLLLNHKNEDYRVKFDRKLIL